MPMRKLVPARWTGARREGASFSSEAAVRVVVGGRSMAVPLARGARSEVLVEKMTCATGAEVETTAARTARLPGDGAAARSD